MKRRLLSPVFLTSLVLAGAGLIPRAVAWCWLGVFFGLSARGIDL